jgi:hypothetical protein
MAVLTIGSGRRAMTRAMPQAAFHFVWKEEAASRSEDTVR